MLVQCRLLTNAERKAREEERRAAVDDWRRRHPFDGDWPPELVTLSRSFFPPGSMWFCPWYYDPTDFTQAGKPEEMVRRMTGHETRHPQHDQGYRWHLSIHYWRDHAKTRPPIEVVCPGGREWCPDQISSNGSGWTVTGEAPNLVVTPSIWVNQGMGAAKGEYHGYLGSNGAPPGWFTNPL